MTGRDLIIYILENNLEDELIFNEGNLVDFLTVNEVAIRMNVGAATVLTWLNQGKLACVILDSMIYIPAKSYITLQSEVTKIE